MGANSSKNRKKTLSDAELSSLVTSTKMTNNEILKWHKGFTYSYFF